MLVLSRKAEEKMTIGDKITIQVIRISGNRVYIGVQAPKSITVLRDNAKVKEPPCASTT